MSNRANALPNLTPVHLTFTLALELLPAASHSSSTFRAHPIQNAGEHICSRFDRTQSDKPHTSPPHHTEESGIENPVQAAKRREILSRSVSGQNVNPNAGECISSSKTGGTRIDISVQKTEIGLRNNVTQLLATASKQQSGNSPRAAVAFAV